MRCVGIYKYEIKSDACGGRHDDSNRAISGGRSTQFGQVTARYITASRMTGINSTVTEKYGAHCSVTRRPWLRVRAHAASRAPLACSIMDRWTPWPPWASARNDHYGLWLLLEIFLVISTGDGNLAIITDYYALCPLITPRLLSNVISWHQVAVAAYWDCWRIIHRYRERFL